MLKTGVTKQLFTSREGLTEYDPCQTLRFLRTFLFKGTFDEALEKDKEFNKHIDEDTSKDVHITMVDKRLTGTRDSEENVGVFAASSTLR